MPIASFLGTLATKLRAHVEELGDSGPLPEFVLNVGANNSGGVLGTKGERLAAIAFGAPAIFPGVHLFGDDVGFLTDAAGEELGGFENGSTNFLEVIFAEHIAADGLDVV